jgi:hypothetical protein
VIATLGDYIERTNQFIGNRHPRKNVTAVFTVCAIKVFLLELSNVRLTLNFIGFFIVMGCMAEASSCLNFINIPKFEYVARIPQLEQRVNINPEVKVLSPLIGLR